MSDEKPKKETVLNTLFECREENLYALTEKDKERIATLTKDNDSYEKLFSIIERLPHTQEDLESIRNSLDSYIDRINIIGTYENENFYKIRIFRCNKFSPRMCEKIRNKEYIRILANKLYYDILFLYIYSNFISSSEMLYNSSLFSILTGFTSQPLNLHCLINSSYLLIPFISFKVITTPNFIPLPSPLPKRSFDFMLNPHDVFS